GRSLTNFDCTLRTRSGRQVECLCSAQPIELNGEDCWLAVSRDVTDCKEAEARQRKLESQLQQAQKMEALGTLAGGIAHDFNNLRGSIPGNVALTGYDRAVSGTSSECLNEIRVASLRARDLVRQILAFSRQHPLLRRPLKLQPTVHEAANLLRATV